MKEIRVENPVVDAAEEVAFIIPGKRNGAETEERFVCLANPPFATISQLGQRHNIDAYIRLCLKPNEEKRWDELMIDKTFEVHPQAVRDVYVGLVEHYADRPTQGSTASGSGPDDTGTSSTDAGASPDSVTSSEG